MLTFSAVFLVACGAFAVFQAATGHFLPHDATYLGMSASQLCAVDDCRILQFMIHDRISFGGVLVAIGVVYLWLARFPMARMESWSRWTLAGVAGFSTAVGVHPAIGYVSFTHLAQAVLGCVVFAAGLAFAIRGSRV